LNYTRAAGLQQPAMVQVGEDRVIERPG